MAEKSIAQKLLIKPGQRLVIINPPPGYLDTLRPLPERARKVDKPDGPVEFVQLFIKDQSELQELGAQALELCQPSGLYWIAYPKQSSGVKSDINRDIIWKLMEYSGWRPVAMVSIDSTWSVMRLRPAEQVGK